VAVSALILTLAITWVYVSRPAERSQDFVVLAEASIALIIVFMVTSRVLSPQNIFWLLPFAPFLTGVPYRLVLATMLATVAVFPLVYSSLIAQDLGAVVLLNVRNVLLVTVAVVLLARARGAIAGGLKSGSTMA
jgi:hypothetical protein